MRPGDARKPGRIGSKPAHQERGYTFVAVLVLLALCMLGLGIAGPLWSQQVRRDREQELLRIGAAYAQALADYRDNAPGALKRYPLQLENLLIDARFVGTVRHLRELYPDPVNPGQPWGLLLDRDNGIVGVYSRSEEAPLIEGPIDLGPVALPPAKRYSDWKFIATPRTP